MATLGLSGRGGSDWLTIRGEGGGMYRILPAYDFRQSFSQTLLRVGQAGERVLITRNGHDLAGLVSAHDLDRLEQVDAHSEAMLEERHRRMMAEFRRLKEGGG